MVMNSTSAPTGRRIVAWMGLAGVAIGVAVCLAQPPGWLVSPRSWAAVPLGVGVAALAVALFVGLRRARPGILVGGVAAATLLLFGWTTLDQAAWVNRTQDFPLLAARVERHARGGEVAVYGGRYFPLDFYLGRPLVRLRHPQELNDFLRRPGAPSVVLDDRAWKSLRSLIEPPVVELDMLRVRAWKMHVVRRADAPGTTVGLAPAPR